MASFDDFRISGKEVPASLLDDEPWTIPLFTRQYEKTASDIYIPERIKIAIANISPRDDGHHLLIHGLGGAEAWGPNRNGDAFPEYINGEPHLVKRGADYGYGTFETHAYPYRNHKNHDPKHTIGEKIKCAAYNDKMHRVEIIAFIKRALAPELCQMIDDGEDVAWSMGTKVAYDICSKCHNQAKNRSEYCGHLKEAMNRMHPDGSKNYAINPFAKFFDISWVKRGADTQARTLQKVARYQTPLFNVPASLLSIMLPFNPKLADEKGADIEKEVPVKANPMPEEAAGHMCDDLQHDEASRQPRKIVIMILSKRERPVEHRLSDLLHGGIMPTGEECKMAGLQDSDIPDSIKCADPGIRVLMDLAPIMRDSSMLEPYLSQRLASNADRSETKVASYGSKIDKLIYNCFSDHEWCHKYAQNLSQPEVRHIVFPPEMAEKLAFMGEGVVKSVGKHIGGMPLATGFGGALAGTILSASMRGAEGRGKRLNAMQRFMANHPLLTGLGAATLGHGIGRMSGGIKGMVGSMGDKLKSGYGAVKSKLTPESPPMAVPQKPEVPGTDPAKNVPGAQ